MAEQSTSAGRRSLLLAAALAVLAVVGGLVVSRWRGAPGTPGLQMPDSVSRLAPGTPIGDATILQVVGGPAQSVRVELSTTSGGTVSIEVLPTARAAAAPTVQTPSLALYLVPPDGGVSAEEAGALVQALAARLAQAAPSDAGRPRSRDPHVIPAGQEALLAQMLGQGAELPGGCRWEDASVEWSSVTSRYTCGTQTRILTLCHPSSECARSALVTTSAFAMSGDLPPQLIEAVAGRIREKEGSFHWQLEGSSSPAPAEGPREGLLLVGGALVAAALVTIALRRGKTPG